MSNSSGCSCLRAHLNSVISCLFFAASLAVSMREVTLGKESLLAYDEPVHDIENKVELQAFLLFLHWQQPAYFMVHKFLHF